MCLPSSTSTRGFASEDDAPQDKLLVGSPEVGKPSCAANSSMTARILGDASLAAIADFSVCS